MDAILDLREGDSGFTLSFGGRVILRHSRSRPCCGLGTGDFAFRLSHGMYHITRDRRRDWREAGDYRATIEPGGSVLLDFPGLLGLRASARGSGLRLETLPADPRDGAARLELRLELDATESIHGCGEQFSWLDLRGHRLPLLVSEPGVGRGPNWLTLAANLHSGVGGSRAHTYFPLPAFVTSGGLSVFAESSAYAVFDFRAPDRAGLSFREIPPAIEFGLAPDLAGAVGALSALLGRQPAPPPWCQEGAWLGVQGGTRVVEAKLDAALAAGARISALWCQDWQGIRMTPFGKQLLWNWDWDRSLYPEPEAFIGRLHARGIRFLGYVNPFLAADAPMFAEAAAAGRLVLDRDGQPYLTRTTTFPAGILDLSAPGTRTWFKGIVKERLLGSGMDGWMADFGEYLPPDCVMASGEDPARAHNVYASDWAVLNREAVEEAGALGKAIFFCRSGWSASPGKALAFWGGDQLVNLWRDHGLAAALNAGLSAGTCGVALWHFDLGGFLSLAFIRRNAETFARSAELAAFCPFMRSHEGIDPGANVQFDSDPATLALFARMTRVHAALAPYHKALVDEYLGTGLPPMRLPRLHHGESPEALAARDQYLYGRDLMVAPVLRRGARSRKVRLPEGPWIHLWSGAPRAAGVFREAAPFGEPPVYYRDDSTFAGLFAGLAEAARGTLPARTQSADKEPT